MCDACDCCSCQCDDCAEFDADELGEDPEDDGQPGEARADVEELLRRKGRRYPGEIVED